MAQEPQAVSSKNSNLRRAKKEQNDEFYTQWRDIENEMHAYLDFNPDVFRDKTILLPCDDPAWSNFTKFFALNFDSFGIKKLISTSYAPASNPAFETYEEYVSQFSPRDRGDAEFCDDKQWTNGRIYVIERDVNRDGRINIEDLEWEYLEGDGDFRSAEVTALRDEADMVVTNPPFSKFREFMAWLIEGDVEFAVIGNNNALTYKEIFPLIKSNEVWKGATSNVEDMVFEVPLSADIKRPNIEKAARLGYPSSETQKFTRMGNSCWFTNIQHGRRHSPMVLMTMEQNLRYGPKKIRENGYPTYDNYDAIEVAEKIAIPSDYAGVMGVPITFLDVYCPEQFEILGSQRWGKSQELLDVYTGDVVPPENDKKTLIDGKETYDRIFIKHKTQSDQE